jgi:hypothetical protein
MRSLLLTLVLLAFVPGQVLAQAEPPYISSPATGEAVQGVVTISGTSAVAGFVSAEVACAYADNPTNTWFVITTSQQPVSDGTLAVWDTTTISDGTYFLRLRVFLPDNVTLEMSVANVRVRNYTAVETPTPTATPVIALPTLTPTITPPPLPTPTPLPRNPAAVDNRSLLVSLGAGALIVIVLLILFSLYIRARRS